MNVDALAYTILTEPHTLISGCTGSGKSTLLHTVLKTADALNYKYFIIDLKHVSLLAHKSKSIAYATEPDEALALLDRVIDIMHGRLLEIEEAGRDMTTRPPVYLVVDECADLLATIPKSYDKLIRIGRIGRCCQVHEILASQSPNRKVLTANLVQNLTCKVGLRCDNAIESRQVIGQAGCETLPRYGLAIVKTPQGIDKWKVNKYD